jgi:hypothetical protein
MSGGDMNQNEPRQGVPPTVSPGPTPPHRSAPDMDAAPVSQHAAQNDPRRRDGVDAEPITLSGQKARQAGGEWTPIRVLVFGLSLAALVFVLSFLLGD